VSSFFKTSYDAGLANPLTPGLMYETTHNIASLSLRGTRNRVEETKLLQTPFQYSHNATGLLQ
jgi:hypothetical protein